MADTVQHAGDSGEVRPAGPTPFKRLLVWPALILGGAELIGVVLPMWTLFGFDRIAPSNLIRIVVPVGGAAAVIWLVALATWLAPQRLKQ